ncbi:MAG: glycerol kinase [Oceanicoccus sp.]|jgi:glycerol kinase
MTKQTGILSIDQGTTSSRAIVFDSSGNIISVAQREFPQLFPNDGWVEHDPETIWESTLVSANNALTQAKLAGVTVECIGITNQRETTIVWDRESGKPVYNAIVWQDRRTQKRCQELLDRNLENDIQAKTGLLIDPYFSCSKLAWILDNVEGTRSLAEQGKLAFGTVDCFLIWRLTGGLSHFTDATNASRTGLFNIHTQQWDEELLHLYNIPASLLPEVKDSAAEFGVTSRPLLGQSIPILGVAGDQQAAAIGQCCFEPGAIKSTYGTGCFVLMNTGEEAFVSNNRLLTTVAYRIGGKTTYAIEGSIFVAGAAIQWLRDGLRIIQNASETTALAESLDSNHGVYFVPALTGLGAPYWQPDARGAIFGLTRDTGPAEIARAALESVCYQTSDLFSAMASDGVNPSCIRVDGGMVANNWMSQFLSDILNLPVERPVVLETTALGAAYLAGYQAGIYNSLEELAEQWRCGKRFEPSFNEESRNKLIAGWHKAVNKVLE